MKRGEPFERVLAFVGIGLWVLWTVLLFSPGQPLEAVAFAVGFLGVALTALSVIEYRTWQRGLPALRASGRKRWEQGKPALPVTSWYALGAVPASFLAAFVIGIVGADVRGNSWVFFVAWIVGGTLMTRLMQRASDRRERRVIDSLPPRPV